jgi:hypothetical protein
LKMSKRARQKANDLFSVERIVPEVETIYRQLMK